MNTDKPVIWKCYVSYKGWPFVFSNQSAKFLEDQLCIKVPAYEANLISKIGDNKAIAFDGLVRFMIDDENSTLQKDRDIITQHVEFEEFRDRCINYLNNQINISDEVFECANEIIIYFDRLYCGGLIELFKFRQAEYKGPKIYIKQRIVPDCQVNDHLPNRVVAFRGMSFKEYDSGSFGMHWSLSIAKARQFAFTTYSDQKGGVVAKAIIERDEVLYFDPQDHEKEILVRDNSVKNASIAEE